MIFSSRGEHLESSPLSANVMLMNKTGAIEKIEQTAKATTNVYEAA